MLEGKRMCFRIEREIVRIGVRRERERERICFRIEREIVRMCVRRERECVRRERGV